jgi:hypothetical protein
MNRTGFIGGKPHCNRQSGAMPCGILKKGKSPCGMASNPRNKQIASIFKNNLLAYIKANPG